MAVIQRAADRRVEIRTISWTGRRSFIHSHPVIILSQVLDEVTKHFTDRFRFTLHSFLMIVQFFLQLGDNHSQIGPRVEWINYRLEFVFVRCNRSRQQSSFVIYFLYVLWTKKWFDRMLSLARILLIISFEQNWSRLRCDYN